MLAPFRLYLYPNYLKCSFVSDFQHENAAIHDFLDESQHVVTSFPSARLTALRIFNVAIVNTQDVSKELIQTHVAMVEAALYDPQRIQKSIKRAVLAFFQQRPEIKDIYVEFALEKGSFMLLGIFLSKSVENRPAYFKSYCTNVLESKARLDREQMNCFKELLGSMKADEFKLMESTMSKMLKKAPDTALQVVSHLFSCVSVDIGAKDIVMPVLLTKLKSQNEDVRKLCVSISSRLVSTCSDIDVILSIASDLKAVLDGKRGILAQFYQREAIVQALDGVYECFHTLLFSEFQTVATTVIEALAKAVSKEAHEETRKYTLKCLGKWVNTSKLFPDCVSKALDAGLKKYGEDYLYALDVICSFDEPSTDIIKGVNTFSDKVKGFLKDKKRINRAGVWALSILSVLEHQLPVDLSDSDLFVYHTMQQVGPEDPLCFALARIFCFGLLSPTEPVCEALLELCLSRNRHVRAYATLKTSKLVAQDKLLSAKLVNALFLIIDRPREVPSSAYVIALKSIVPDVVGEHAIHLFPKVLILSAHPLVNPAKRNTGKYWKVLSSRFQDIEELLEQDSIKQELVNQILACEEATCETQLEMYIRSISLLFESVNGDDLMVYGVFKQIGLDLSDVKLSERELALYRNIELPPVKESEITEENKVMDLDEINQMYERTKRMTQLIQGVSHLNPDEMHRTLPILLTPLRNIFPVFPELASQTLSMILKCVQPELRKDSSSILAAILVNPSAFDLTRIIDVEILPSSLHVILVILQDILIRKTEQFEMAYEIFKTHARMITEEEEMETGDMAALRLLRRPMIEITLCIPNCSSVLNQLCESPPFSIGEWTPLLGEMGFLNPEPTIRFACIAAIRQMIESCGELKGKKNPLVVSRLWQSRFDSIQENAELAHIVWGISECVLPKAYNAPLLALLSHDDDGVRISAAKALAGAMLEYPESSRITAENLLTNYRNRLPKVKKEEFGFRRETVEVESKKTWLARYGVGLAIEICAKEKAFVDDIESLIQFVVETGLCDSHATVQTQMMKAGVQLVDAYGGEMISTLITLFDAILDNQSATQQVYDRQREGVVVCLGGLAKHMDKTDPKVASIIQTLLETLNIPSESVQRAVANCLVPLAPSMRDSSDVLIGSLLSTATSAASYGERMGAAFGLAAVVKGLGISALKQQNVIPQLQDAINDAKKPDRRQGGFLVLECLSERLGFLFEPYVIIILPILLKAFADSVEYVREAASNASKQIMSKLSTHGVKLILPSLIKSLQQDSAWRTQKAAIQLLGNMAYCAPRQLSSCLPQIVPKLSSALGDSHHRVREAGKLALRDIGSVIRNPEIKELTEVLLLALEDPSTKTSGTLITLRSTTFVHSIDAPSLALIVPVLHRGLRETDGDSKKSAALIVGNMCSMITDAKDILPYLNLLLPRLQELLMDPIPQVRSVSATAMGKLVKGVGESHFPDVIPWLIESIMKDTSSVERSGTAQGLCQVLVALGAQKLDTTLIDLFPLASHPKYYVREGILWVVAFLSGLPEFSHYITKTLPIVISGLSDETDSVREVAMHAGQVIVSVHGLKHTGLILPSLEEGLFDIDWRIRQSAVTLLGDLLYRIGGTRAIGMAENDDDEGTGSAATDLEIIKALGQERRNNILASLYILRSDSSAVVRQCALQVWKTIVVNTPRTLREVLECLISSVLSFLNSDDHRTLGERSLGEIVSKLGERVMSEILPILKAKNNCTGLNELIQNAPTKVIEDYANDFIELVTEGLSNPDPTVRSAAAASFQTLHKYIGTRIVDSVLPVLLAKNAIAGVQEILSLKTRGILPYLIPKLVQKPRTESNLRALVSVAHAAPDTIHYQLDTILSSLFDEFEQNPQLVKDCLKDIVLHVNEIQWLNVELTKYSTHQKKASYRALGCWCIGTFCAGTSLDYSAHLAVFLKNLLSRMADVETETLVEVLAALKSIQKTTSLDVLATNHLEFIRNSINSMVSDAKHRKNSQGLVILSLPKALEPFLPIYQHALMYGSAELRQLAATGLGELVELTDAKVLRPFLIKLTGPLIRIVGDRFPSHVKAAILSTLGVILEKGGVALKPFVPQLQTTFLKALLDPTASVRNHGTIALGKVMQLSGRIDPVVLELIEKIKDDSLESSLQESHAEALYQVLKNVGSKVKVISECIELFKTTDTADKMPHTSEKCLAQLIPMLSDTNDLTKFVQDTTQSSTRRLVFLNQLMQRQEWTKSNASSVLSTLPEESIDVATQILRVRAIGTMVLETCQGIEQLASEVSAANKEVCKAALKAIKTFAKEKPDTCGRFLSVIVPPLQKLIKSTNISVKMAMERTLLHVLQIHSRPDTLEKYLETLEATDRKILAEYSRRVLQKLNAAQSDDEN